MEEENKNGSRKQYSTEAKYKIVKEALTTDQGITAVCRKYGLRTSTFYRWQDLFFSGARKALEDSGTKGLTSKEQRELEGLKTENVRMKDVIAEITSENIGLKKKNLV